MILFLLLSGLGLIVLQMFMPEIHILHARPYLLPTLVAYASLRFGLVRGLVVAVGLGFILDLFSSGRLGVSCLSFSLMSLFLYSQTENFNLRSVLQAALLTLLSVFLYLTLDYFFFCWQIESWRWPTVVWEGMASQAFADAILSVPLFWLFDLIESWLPRGKTYV